MIQTYDFFNQADIPAIFLCNPNREILGSLGKVVYDTKLKLRFNALSDFSFTVPKSIDNGATTLAVYDKIKVKKQVYIENIGYFIIVSAVENNDGSTPTMEVECQSLEAEMLNKKVNILSGTCRLYAVDDPYNISPTQNLMGYILSLLNANVDLGSIGALNGWTLSGEIDATLASRYRTFDISDSTIYGFLMNDVAKAYECVFLFDTINREIFIKTLDGAVTETTIFMSHDNLLKSSELNELSDEIVTALYVYGGDGLEIRSVNPTGSNIIYDFSYYKNDDWMTQSLQDAITAWENKIESYALSYNTKITKLITDNELLSGYEVALNSYENTYAELEINLKIAIETGDNSLVLNAKNALDAQAVLISNYTNQYITPIETEIALTTSQIVVINETLSMSNPLNFTEAQRIELSRYIIENTYQNENIIITDNHTPAQVQETKLELYNQGLSVLSRVSQPRYEFSIDSVNFISLKQFSNFTNQIPVTLGAQITIQGASVPISSVLLELEMSYDNPENFSLTFSNRLRLDNGKFQYSDLVGQVVETGSSVSFDRPKWANWTNTYKDDVRTFITSSLDATRNEIINSSDQEIVINGAGLRGRKVTNGAYESNQVWLTSNTLAFTDDNWASAKTAVGKISLGGGLYGYGIAGQYLIGEILVGTDLTIRNSNNSFVVNQTGATLTNAKLTVQSQLGGTGGIIIDPNSANVVSIGSIAGGIIGFPKFSVDVSGNITMNGSLELTATNNYIRTTGYIRLGTASSALTINPLTDTAEFTGTIKADKILGAVSYTQLTDIPATKITSGTMSGNRVSGGILGGTIGMAGGLVSVYQSGSSVAIDASSSSYLKLIGSGSSYVQVQNNNIIINGGTSVYGGLTAYGIIASSSSIYSDYDQLVATQNWVSGRGYLTAVPSNISISTISASQYNTAGYAGTDGDIYFKDTGNVTRHIIVRNGIVTLLA